MPPQPASLDDLPEWQPPGQPAAPAPTTGGGVRGSQPAVSMGPGGQPRIEVYRPNLEDLPDWSPPEPPSRQIGGTEAAYTGVKSGLSFGLEPAYRGLAEAGNEVLRRHLPGWVKPEDVDYLPSPLLAHIGAAKELWDWTTGHDDPEVEAARERGRKFAQETVDLSREQLPWHFYGGMILGSLGMPGLGPEITAARLATVAPKVVAAAPKLAQAGARIAEGATQGALYGGLQSGGEAISRGESAPEVGREALRGAAFGAPTGAVLHGALGAREPPAVPTSGQRAAQTARELGAPLPRGVTSDRPIVQSTTARLQSVPFTGTQIIKRVAKTAEAAGERVKDISEQMAPGVTSRAEAGTTVKSGLQDVIDANHREIDAAYDRLRSYLPGAGDGSVHPMPRMKAALDTVTARRVARGKTADDLAQFRRIEDGTTFNGAQAARTDARSPNPAMRQHQGFDARDWNYIAKAMTGDLEDMVKQGAIGNAKNPQQALRAFKEADAKFGPLADQNEKLQKLINLSDEGAIARLVGKAGEKAGDLQTLVELRRSMPPDKFAQIGATILRETGIRSSEQGQQFSLRTFTNGWDKLSDGAKAALFDQAHRRNIDDIVDMTRHIGGALIETNTSKTANALLLWDLGKTLVEGTAMAAAGVYAPSTIAYAVGTGAIAHAMSLLLATPAKAAATRSLLAARTAWGLNPTPARTAVFKIATRNAANTLGVPIEKLEQIVQGQPQSQEAATP